MSFTAYIVPTELLETAPPRAGEWHATASLADPTQSLVVVEWDRDASAVTEFEAQAGVVLLGLPWETIPAAALPLLALFQDEATVSAGTGSVALPSVDPVPDVTSSPAPVSTAMRGVSWPGARLLR